MQGVHVQPAGIDEQTLVGQGGASRLQVQAAADRHRHDAVAEAAGDGGQRLHARGVGPRRQADEQRAADAEHVAAFEPGRRVDADDFAVLSQFRLDAGRLGPPGGGPHRREHGDFVEHDRGVFDEHAVRRVAVDVKRDHVRPATAEQIAVRGVLADGAAAIDRHAADVGALAVV